jgi:hypothetical protein
MKRAANDEKQLEIALNIFFVASAISFAFYLVEVFKKTEGNFWLVFLHLLTTPSYFASDLMVYIYQFIFMNFSIQICSLLKQIDDELKDMNFIRDAKRVTEIFGGVSESHNEIQAIVREFMSCFENILKLNFILSACLVAQITIFSFESGWVNFMYGSPYLLFEAWLYCYAAQKITSKVCSEAFLCVFVKKLFYSQTSDLAFEIYSVNWCKFDDNSSQKLIVSLIQKFQNPVKLVIFKVMEIDLERFVMVSFPKFA